MDRLPPDRTRRSDSAHRAILGSAWKLFQACGLRRLTIEAIAADAGVGKATIYRWWPSKSAVLMDALEAHLDPEIPFPDTGSAREDLREQIAGVIELLTSTRAGKAYLALVAESQHDPQLAKLAQQYIAQRRAGAAAIFERGVRRGELRADLDSEIAIDALWGAVYYRLLVSHAPTEPAYAGVLVDQIYPALENRRR